MRGNYAFRCGDLSTQKGKVQFYYDCKGAKVIIEILIYPGSPYRIGEPVAGSPRCSRCGRSWTTRCGGGRTA